MDNIKNSYSAVAPNSKKNLIARLLYMPLVHIVIIMLLGLAVYSNTYNVPFQLDDIPYIVKYLGVNKLPSVINSIEDIKSSVIKDAFKSGMITRPFAFLTFSANYQISGLKVSAYHVTNILIHIATALLLYSLVRIGFKTPFFKSKLNAPYSSELVSGVAFFAATLFVVHPIQTQAVTYIVQRFTSLATFLYVLTLLLYIKSNLTQNIYRKSGFYLVSFISAVLAMLTKEIAITLPFIIIVFELMFLDGRLTRKLTRCVLFLLTIGIIPYNILNAKNILYITANLADAVNGWAGNAKLTSIEYLLTEFRVIVTYLRLLLLPVNQNFYYDYPASYSFFEPLVLFSFLLLSTIVIAGIFLLRQSTKNNGLESYLCRVAAFGIFWFFITLSVESTFFPIQSVIDEHRIYLPSVGFFIAVVSFVTILIMRLLPAERGKTLISFLALLMVITFAVTAYKRNNVWRYTVTLWEDVVKKSPQQAVGHVNLCAAYLNHNRLDDAEKECSKALTLSPDFTNACYNLGLINERKNQKLQAAGFYRKAIKLDSRNIDAHVALAKIYQEQGFLYNAMYEYKAANALDNNNFPAHYNLGLIYYDLGQYGNAINEYTEALRLKPEFAPLYNSMGIALYRSGASEKAVLMIKKALHLEPNNINAISNLQKIEARRGRI